MHGLRHGAAASALAELCAGAPRRAAAATLGFAAGSIFLGGAPKTLAVANAERVARRAVPLVRAAAVVLAPVGAFFGALAQLCLAPPASPRGDAAALGVSERGLRLLVAGARRGALGARESRMVDGVLDLRATRVAEVMTPRVDVVALAGGAPLSEALDLMRAAKRSRVLVYEKDVDDVVGVLLAKTLIRYAERGGAAALRSTRARDEPALESPYFVPGSMSVWASAQSISRDAPRHGSIMDLHAIDATPARRREPVWSPLVSANTAAFSPRNDLVKNYRVHPTHWLIYAQVWAALGASGGGGGTGRGGRHGGTAAS